MKKFYYLIVGIITLFINDNVFALYEVKNDESTLLAKCQYEVTDKFDNVQKLIVDIKKDYTVQLVYMSVYTASTSPNHKVYISSNDFTYEKFIAENGKVDCNSVDKIYHYITVASDGATRQSSTTHHLQPSAFDKKPSGLSGGEYTYSLNESASKIYVTDNYDEGVIEDEGWLRICHYGSYYLKFNKEKYDTNIGPLVNHFGIDPDNIDIMSYLSETNYSCPTSLCSKTEGAMGYTYTRYTFKMEYDNSCITSQDFVSEYRCGSLEFHMKDYTKLKNSTDKKDISKLDERIKQIKNFCSSVYQNQDYDDPTYCVKECIEIDEIFIKDMGESNTGECGFSQRLLVWIINILRWIKYILPVVVIIFGILDFMKAIGADKDDEMKKAQKRFIIRLIASALVFIIPLIIEFILDKMGFGYDSCGLF